MQGRLFERDIYTEKFFSAADAQQVRSPLFKRVWAVGKRFSGLANDAEPELENISNKKIEAIEIDVLLINAFNETISSFPMSKRVSLIPYEIVQCRWKLDNLPDIDDTKTNLKRVLFTDGTSWINKN